MERFLVLAFSLLFSIPSFAAIPSGVPAVSLCAQANVSSIGSGAILAADASSYKTLTVAQGDATATHYYQVWDNSNMSSGAQYQVPTGKHFYGVCVCGASLQTSANQTLPFQIGEATATFTNGASTAPTGAKYQTGAAGAAGISLHVVATDQVSGVAGLSCQPVTYTFDPLYYPFIQSYIGAGAGIAYGSTYTLWLIGVER